MKPAPFKYFVPESRDEALELLCEHGFDAKILAGGQSLVPTMNFRLAQPEVVIDINRIQALSYLRKKDGFLQIGALSRHAELERNADIAESAPLLSATMPHIAHPQIRNRGTIGGSLVHADPAAELPAIMLALDAKFKLQSKEQTRVVNAQDFFIDLFMTALEPEELLVEIELPEQTNGLGYAFEEVARRHGDFALAGAAAIINQDADSKCSSARIVLINVGNRPVQATSAEKLLIGEKKSDELIQAAAEAAIQDIDPPSDMHASSEFRRHLTKVLVQKVLNKAFKR